MEKERQRLTGWKEIANYLRVSERTARRWEESGLPVHRLFPEQRSTVYCWTDELDQWFVAQSRQPQAQIPAETEAPQVSAAAAAGGGQAAGSTTARNPIDHHNHGGASRSNGTSVDVELTATSLPAIDQAQRRNPAKAVARNLTGRRVGLGLGLATLLLAVSWATFRAPAEPAIPAPLVARPFARSSALDYSPVLSPKGNQVVFCRKLADSPAANLWLREVETDVERPLTQAMAREHGPAWSPDGNTIAFLRRSMDGTVKAVVLNVKDQSEKELATIPRTRWLFPNGPEVAFSLDGQRIFVVQHTDNFTSSELLAIDIADGTSKKLLRLEGEIAVAPSLSPDGSRLGLLIRRAEPTASASTYALFLYPIQAGGEVSGPRTQVSPKGVNCQNHAWLNAEKLLLVLLRERAPKLVRLDLARNEITPLPLADNQFSEISYHAGTNFAVYSRYSWNLDTVGFSLESGRIGQELRTYGASKENEFALAYHPTGEQVAFASGARGPMEIFVEGLPGSAKPVTQIKGELAANATWLPGGKQLMFIALVGTQRGLFHTDLVSGTTRQVAQGMRLAGQLAPALHPDFVYLTTDQNVLTKLNWRTGEAKQLVPQVVGLAVHPEDGTIYLLREKGELWRCGPDGQELRQLASDGLLAIAVSRNWVWGQRKIGADRMGVWRYSLKGGEGKAVGVEARTLLEGLAIRPDEKEVGMVVFRDFDADLMSVRLPEETL